MPFVALPAVLELVNPVVPPKLVVMVALPAVLVLLKVVDPPRLLMMVALPAVLEPRKARNPRGSCAGPGNRACAAPRNFCRW